MKDMKVEKYTCVDACTHTNAGHDSRKGAVLGKEDT